MTNELLIGYGVSPDLTNPARVINYTQLPQVWDVPDNSKVTTRVQTNGKSSALFNPSTVNFSLTVGSNSTRYLNVNVSAFRVNIPNDTVRSIMSIGPEHTLDEIKSNN